MSLYTEVVARVPNQTLVTLTNQQSTSATTIATTLLQTACDDIAAQFATYAGETFDVTVRRHVVLGVAGVLALLRSWNPIQAEGADGAMDRWIAAVTAYSETAARDHRSIYSSSQLTPSDEVDGSQDVRPWSDPEAFDGYAPGMP